MSEAITVTLIGGDFDGKEVENVHWGQTLVIKGDPLPEGILARYRPTRKKPTYRFKELDRVIGTISLPDGSET